MYKQITYNGFYALGGSNNPKLFSRPVYLGKHFMHTVYYMYI